MRLFILALLVLAPHGMAATLVTNGDGKVTGINELLLERGYGINYDVTFTVGSFDDVIGADAFLYEGDGNGAAATIVSIRDFLNAENVEQVAVPDSTNIQVPFAEEGAGCSDDTDVRAAQIAYRDDTAEWFKYGDLCDPGVLNNGYAYAQFTVSQNQPSMPIPAMPALGLLLLALGVIALGSRRSRWTKS